MGNPFRCSDAARARGESMAGTAPVGRFLLLIEHAGPWANKPLQSAPLNTIAADLQARIDAADAQVLLVRRPGREGRTLAQHCWWVIDTATGRATHGLWHDPTDLLDAATHLTGLPDDAGEAPRMILVCTHATRDVCCAVRGRPIVAALATALPDATWECSHLGGHRFAGTMMLVPDGLLLGGLDPDSAIEQARRHFLGRIGPEHYRGHARLDKPAQVAVAKHLTMTGETSLESIGDATVSIAAGQDDEPVSAWDVTLTGPSATTHWHVSNVPGEPVLQSCAAIEPGASPVWTVTAR